MDKIFRNEKIFYILLCFILTALFYFPNATAIEERIAAHGFSPLHYVHQKIHPENFRDNFENGIIEYEHTLAMQVYYWLAKYAGIYPEESVYSIIFLQIFILSLALHHLGFLIHKDRFLAFLCTIIIIGGYAPGINLGFFGHGVGQMAYRPLYYAWADICWLLAVAFSLDRRHFLSFAMLTLGFYIHPVLTAFALLFIGSSALLDKDLLKDKKFWIAGILFALAVAPRVASLLSSSELGPQIPLKDWLLQARIMSWHWFPLLMGSASGHTVLRVAGFTLWMLFFFISLGDYPLSNKYNKRMVQGMLGCLILAVIGYVTVDSIEQPFIIRLCPQRASYLVSLTATFFIIPFIWRRMISGPLLIRFLCSYALIVLVCGQPGLSMMIILGLGFNDMIQNKKLGPINLKEGPVAKTVWIIISVFICLITMVNMAAVMTAHPLFVKLTNGVLNPSLGLFNPLSEFDLFFWGGGIQINKYVLCLLAFVCFGFSLCREKKYDSLWRALVLLTLLFCLHLKQVDLVDWFRKDYGSHAKSHVAMQKWMREHTPEDSLFMHDPRSQHIGRDYSQRSSFGTAMEWIYGTIAYLNNYENFVEGRKRAKLMGFNVDLMSPQDPLLIGRQAAPMVDQIMSYNYYNMSQPLIDRLINEYGVDYFTFFKESFIDIPNDNWRQFKTVYQNDIFVVLAVPKK